MIRFSAGATPRNNFGAGANEKPVECPQCGEDMQDTGKREQSEITKRPMRIMHCACCGNEAGVSTSEGTPRR